MLAEMRYFYWPKKDQPHLFFGCGVVAELSRMVG